MEEVEILYADMRIVVCVKPAGILSTDEPGGLPELLRKQLAGDSPCVRTVHRLDRMVGGVMVLARSRKAASLLAEQVRNRQFSKEYLAVVHGAPKETNGTLRDGMYRNMEEKKSFLVPVNAPNSQTAVLDYEVLERHEDMTLLRIVLHTGRTHQIRCQLSGHGWPILGDRKYGKSDGVESIALWSRRIGFSHPQSGEPCRFAAPPPAIYPWTEFGIQCEL